MSLLSRVFCLAVYCLALALASGHASASRGQVVVLTIDGVINPMTARYLERELNRAARTGSEAVVLRLNTPGGLESSMREMTQAMLQSTVPVVVYVWPQGARAASAGMFLTIAAHVAAMAPGTNVGAAHPVAIGGAGSSAPAGDETMKTKAVEDAAALARSIAETRGRNSRWAAEAVTKSVSITATEALEKNVIDIVANDFEQLLNKLNGQKVKTAGGTFTLNTAQAEVAEREMSLPERIMHAITDPNIAYLLMTIGFIGIIAEIYSPGLIIPGTVGVVSLILSFIAFGSLPISWGGVILLAIGVGLLVTDLLTEGFGFLGIAGIGAFILGSLILYSPLSPVSPSMPDVQVSRWLILLMAALVALFFFIVGRAVYRARKLPVSTGVEALIGRTGVATTELAPHGLVRIDSEIWNAETDGRAIRPGETVQVTEVHGVTLRVEEKKHAA